MGNLLAPLTGPFNLFFYEPIYNLLMGIYQLIHVVLPVGAFAAAIIVLTLLLRSCMIPLTRKQLKSSREMQVLQPKLKELQAQYKNNPQELMAAQRALYKEHGVSPMSGCLPLLIQLPFLYALYGAFLTVLPRTGKPSLAHINHDLYPFVPHLQHVPDIQFLWTSLGTPDPLHILPVLAAILTFVQLRMAMPVRKKPAPGTASQPDPTTQATSMMQYIMPFFTLFIGWTFPAGLALYWCVSTGFSAVQQFFISGWGSLFVGVPGMEHMVPEPKELPTLSTTTSRTPAGARALAAPASAASSSQSAESGGGLRGMFKQIRDSMATAQTQAQAQAAQQAEQRAATQSQAQAKPATQPSAAATKGDSTGAGAPSRRSRSQREGAMLIKPATSATSQSNPSSPAAPSGDELPEKAIARDASGGSDGMPESNGELPEQTIARLATSDGANGTNGASGANGTNGNGAKNGASAKRAPAGDSGPSRPSGASGSGARPGSSQRKQSGKNMNAPRPRGSRPKGGR